MGEKQLYILFINYSAEKILIIHSSPMGEVGWGTIAPNILQSDTIDLIRNIIIL